MLQFDAQVEALAAHGPSGLVATAVTRIGGNVWDGQLEIWQWPSDACENYMENRVMMGMPCGPGDLTWMYGENNTPILAVAKDDGDIEIFRWCPNSSQSETKRIEGGDGPLVSQVILGEHHDLVNSVSACRTKTNFLASVSSDASLRIWDIEVPDASSQRYDACHGREIYGVAWNGTSESLIGTASADKTVKLWDLRVPDSCAARFKCPYGAECLAWDGSSESLLLVGLDQGSVLTLDKRKFSEAPLRYERRHTGRVGCLVTGTCQGNQVLASCGDDCRTLVTLQESSSSGEGSTNPSGLSRETKLEHGDYARAATFLPLSNGRLRLAAGGWDGQVQLIEL